MSAPRPDGERCLSTIFAASRSSVTCNGGTSVDWPWFRSELTHTLETTYLLLHDNIRIIPRPGGIGGEHEVDIRVRRRELCPCQSRLGREPTGRRIPELGCCAATRPVDESIRMDNT